MQSVYSLRTYDAIAANYIQYDVLTQYLFTNLHRKLIKPLYLVCIRRGLKFAIEQIFCYNLHHIQNPIKI